MSDTSELVKQLRLELAKYLDVVSSFDEDKEFQVLFEVHKFTPEEMKFDFLPRLIDDFVTSLNLMPFNAFGQWRIREVEGVEARTILVNILSQDLAYSGPRYMSKAGALAFVEQVLHLFDSKVRFFTNARFIFNPFRLSSWSPIAMPRTFDTGIVFVDDQQIGILWVTDED